MRWRRYREGAGMSEILAVYAAKQVKGDVMSSFRGATHKMRLTPWRCQLNVGLNSEKFTLRETNAPPGVVRALHFGFLNGIAGSSLSSTAVGALFAFSELLWR